MQMNIKPIQQKTFVIIIVILLIFSIIFIIFGICYKQKNTSRDKLISRFKSNEEDVQIIEFISISGGNIDDVKKEVSTNKIRSNVVDFGTKATNNVMNAIDDFYYRFYSKKRSLFNSSIDDYYREIKFVNQGYNNVIVKIDDTLLRIRKYIPENNNLDIFNNNDLLFKYLKENESKIKHILIPYSYQRYPTNPKTWFMYWEIPQLKRIHNYDPDKLKTCVKCMYSFIRSVNLKTNEKWKIMYLDYKYENFMMNSEGVYMLADYDFPPCKSMTELLKNRLNISKTENDEKIKQLIDKDKKFSADYNFLINPIGLSYYLEKDVNEVENKYNPYLLLTALSMRLFCIQLECNRGTNNVNGYFKLTSKVIDTLLDMKSTNEEDVFDISGFR